MVSRRKLLSWISALPFIGAVGVSSVKASLVELSESEEAPVRRWPDLPVYACKGETVTCENGHPICDFVETVHCGQNQDVRMQLGNWRQDEPQLGALPIPGCAVCGAAFTTGTHYHVGTEWRDPINRALFLNPGSSDV